MASTTTSAASSSGPTAIRPGIRAPRHYAQDLYPSLHRHPGSGRRPRTDPHPAPRLHRPRRRSTLSRSCRGNSFRRFRYQCGRDPQPARSDAPGLSWSPLRLSLTNKVYGDAPNLIRLRELDTRWDYEDPLYEHGIPESFSIDQSKHSLFGASKVAADVMVQEYGRYFNMPTCCLRGGCLTGPSHSGVELTAS